MLRLDHELDHTPKHFSCWGAPLVVVKLQLGPHWFTRNIWALWHSKEVSSSLWQLLSQGLPGYHSGLRDDQETSTVSYWIHICHHWASLSLTSASQELLSVSHRVPVGFFQKQEHHRWGTKLRPVLQVSSSFSSGSVPQRWKSQKVAY